MTYCKPDDSVKDHHAVAVISRPGFTGPFLIFLVCSHQLRRHSQGFVLALTGKEALLIEGLAGTIPSIKFSQEISGNDGHGLVARHLGLVFHFVVDLAIEARFFDQRKGDYVQDLSEQPPAFFGDLVLTLEGAALPGSEAESGIAHELAPVFEVGKRAGFAEKPGHIFIGNDMRGWRRYLGVLGPQSVKDFDHLGSDPVFSLDLLEIVGHQIIKVCLQYFYVPSWHFVHCGTAGIIPQPFKRGFHNSWSFFPHPPTEEVIPIGHDPIGVAAIRLNQSQARVAVEKICFKGVVAEKFHQELTNSATQAGNGDITLIINFVQFPEHQIVLTDKAQFDHLVQFSQSSDNSGIFLVGFVVVVALDDSEFSHGLGINVAGKETKPARSPEEAVLVLAGRLADNPQVCLAMLNGNFVKLPQLLFNDGGPVLTGIGKLLAVDLEEKAKGAFVDVHRDIDHVIEVDFLCILSNFHYGFSFFCVDSTGYELLNSYCTSDFEGEAFLLAA